MENNEIEVEEFEVSSREELLEELKSVYQEIDTNEAKKYQRRWRQFESWGSAYDEEMDDQFYELVNYAFAKVKQEQKNNEMAKRELIKEAQVALGHKNLNEATAKMNELMSSWKKIKGAGRDIDDELWATFNGIRQSFFDLKAKFYQEMQEKFASSKVLKEQLIKEVDEIKDSTEFKKTSDRLNEIMNAWKAAGSSGKEFDDELWSKFNTLRQVFYDRKAQHFAGLEVQYAANNEAKKALIETVREVVNEKYYCKENTDKIKEYTNQWKQIGFSGKECENANWDQFKLLTDMYFSELKTYNENRAQQYHQRQLDRKANLQAKIDREKRAIERLKKDIMATISERGVKELEEEIEEIKEYIVELEQELSEMN